MVISMPPILSCKGRMPACHNDIQTWDDPLKQAMLRT